jgi:hypothetical protein
MLRLPVLQDADAAYSCACDFPEACCVIVKHTNPCGVAARDDLLEVSQIPVPACALTYLCGCSLVSSMIWCHRVPSASEQGGLAAERLCYAGLAVAYLRRHIPLNVNHSTAGVSPGCACRPDQRLWWHRCLQPRCGREAGQGDQGVQVGEGAGQGGRMCIVLRGMLSYVRVIMLQQ